MGGGDTCHNLESHEDFLSDMRPFLSEYHISFYYFFLLKEVKGHEFWAHLKMFIIIFDLLAYILNNGTVNGEMRS